MERTSTSLTQLLLSTGPGEEAIYTLKSEKVILGRDPFSDIVLEHPEVSRHHASLVRRGDGYDLQDMGSTNGTFVDA